MSARLVATPSAEQPTSHSSAVYSAGRRAQYRAPRVRPSHTASPQTRTSGCQATATAALWVRARYQKYGSVGPCGMSWSPIVQ